jgi:uncharacterized membrane protein YfcA
MPSATFAAKHFLVVIIGYLASAFIGISLGLIGGGGSILTVPILVYLFGIDATLATSYSLFIVGSTALVGTVRHRRLGNLQIQTAVAFALPSIVSSIFVRRLILPMIPEELAYISGFALTKDSLLLLLLAALMVWASYSMIKGKAPLITDKAPSKLKLALMGLAVGTVTGLLGAGGGFLIIPALIFFAKLPMKQAVGTSLFIIFLNAVITFAADLQSGVQLNWLLLTAVSVIAFAGMFIGTRLSKKISGTQLKPAFGWFVLLMGVYIIIKEIFL